MMNIFYNNKYNISLGPLDKLHPFDGCKYKKVYEEIKHLDNLKIHDVPNMISEEAITTFLSLSAQKRLSTKSGITQALELAPLMMLPHRAIVRQILNPMKYAVNGTLLAAQHALKGNMCFNLGGGFHHASQNKMEGFCLLNDIGIAVQELRKSGELNHDDKVLIIDTDIHHGNGNALTFLRDENITILDAFSSDLYPIDESTYPRVDVLVQMRSLYSGDRYLSKLNSALAKVESIYTIAFVIAGTDVLKVDPLGNANLNINDVANREVMTFKALKEKGIPAVFLCGGGYSEDSAKAITASIKKLVEL
ncbi:hypothetical protein N9R79_11610 [Vibrio sp.]|nr:hypothetical protein [Vibrio sp.]